MKNNNTNELTKSQLIDLVLNQNAKIKQLEQRVKNLNKNSLRNLSTNYLEDAKKLGYNRPFSLVHFVFPIQIM